MPRKKVPAPSPLASMNFSAVVEPAPTLYTNGVLALPTISTPPGATVRLSGLDLASPIRMSAADAACAQPATIARETTRYRHFETGIVINTVNSQELLQADEAATRGDFDRFSPAGHPELLEQMAEMRLDRALADRQLGRDLFVGLAVRHQPKRRHLARRQLDVRDPFGELRRRRRRQVGLSRQDVADAADQQVGGDVFEHVGLRPGLQGA